jgi:NAD(P)H-dependent FMN reductase
MSKIKAAIVLSTVRPGRLGPRAAKYLANQINKRNTFDITIIDPVDYKIALDEKPMFLMGPDDDPSSALKKLNSVLQEQEAYFIVSAEYNHTPPPPLLNLFDHIGQSTFSHKPAGIFTYSSGPYGGARAAVILRNFLSGIQMLTVAPMVCMTSIGDSSEEGKFKDEKLNGLLDLGTKRLIDHVEWTANAFKSHSEKIKGPQ